MSATEIARVVLVLDACREAAVPAEVLSLARELGGSLVGLMVEDDRLRRAAELPLTCEIGLWSGREQPLEVGSLGQRLSTQAVRHEQRLVEVARRHRLACSFERKRGSRAAATLAARAVADLFYLAATSRPARHVVPLAVYVVYSGSPAAQRALDAAWKLASQQGRSLVMLSLVQDEHEAGSALAAVGARARIEQLDGDGEHLLPALSALHGSALLLPDDAIPAADADFIDALLARLSCPLLLAC